MAAGTGSTVIVKLDFRLSFDHQKTVEGNPVKAPLAYSEAFTQASGTGINQQDDHWYDIGRTLAPSANESLDLAGGLTDPFGDTITFTKLKGLYVKNNSVTAGDILRLGGVANHVPLFGDAASDYTTIQPGEIYFRNIPSAAGITVTAGTGDLIYLAETGGANTVSFDISIWGVGT